MGYQRHHAIIVTHWNESRIEKVHTFAVSLFGRLVTPIVDSNVNHNKSFAILPDGSNEGRDVSNECDKAREQFTRFLESQSLDWVEVQFGDEDGDNKITGSS